MNIVDKRNRLCKYWMAQEVARREHDNPCSDMLTRDEASVLVKEIMLHSIPLNEKIFGKFEGETREFLERCFLDGKDDVTASYGLDSEGELSVFGNHIRDALEWTAANVLTDEDMVTVEHVKELCEQLMEVFRSERR